VIRLYTAALVMVGVLALPVLAIMLVVRRDWRTGLAERWGRVPPTPPGVDAVWLHGASVGEIAALAPLARALRAEHPRCRIVVSSATVGGRTAAATRIPEADDRVLLPLDLPWTVARAFDAVAPRLLVFTETELWPNFLWGAAARGVPAVMVSGRLTYRAFARYRQGRWLFAAVLRAVPWVCAQSLESARRLTALGARAGRVLVAGSLKAATAAPAVEGAPSLAGLGAADVPVIVAASTHAPEEAAVLGAWETIRRHVPAVRLVLAPRRPERFEEVARLLETRGAPFVRRSAARHTGDPTWSAATPVLLLDTLGELAGLHAGARATFVGGTLAPVGGHNLLEPAAHGTPVVFGPHVENVRGVAARLVESGGGFAVGDASGLTAVLGELVGDARRAAQAGAAARGVLDAASGPLAVTLAVIRAALRASGMGSDG
jgi:3-deoxy-D-manno-octulosonic-acid transferase